MNVIFLNSPFSAISTFRTITVTGGTRAHLSAWQRQATVSAAEKIQTSDLSNQNYCGEICESVTKFYTVVCPLLWAFKRYKGCRCATSGWAANDNPNAHTVPQLWICNAFCGEERFFFFQITVAKSNIFMDNFFLIGSQKDDLQDTLRASAVTLAHRIRKQSKGSKRVIFSTFWWSRVGSTGQIVQYVTWNNIVSNCF